MSRSLKTVRAGVVLSILISAATLALLIAVAAKKLKINLATVAAIGASLVCGAYCKPFVLRVPLAAAAVGSQCSVLTGVGRQAAWRSALEKIVTGMRFPCPHPLRPNPTTTAQSVAAFLMFLAVGLFANEDANSGILGTALAYVTS